MSVRNVLVVWQDNRNMELAQEQGEGKIVVDSTLFDLETGQVIVRLTSLTFRAAPAEVRRAYHLDRPDKCACMPHALAGVVVVKPSLAQQTVFALSRKVSMPSARRSLVQLALHAGKWSGTMCCPTLRSVRELPSTFSER